MEKNKFTWLLMSLVFAITFLDSCSKDDDVNNGVPGFPKKETLSVAADETIEFSFTASMDWKLSSLQTWCVIVEGDENKLDVSGNAGHQTVKIHVTDENIGFAETKANLTLRMGGKSEVIVEIIRSAKEYEFTVYDADGNVIESIEVGYNDYIDFSVEANFEFAATDKPEWVVFKGETIFGKANENISSGAQIDKELIVGKYPVEASNKNVIVFENESGTVLFPIPVYFAGMNADIIDISGNTPWDWEVDMEGVNFVQKTQSEDSPEFKDAVPFTIATFKDDYRVIYAEIANDQYWLSDEEGEDVTWLQLVEGDTPGEVTVKVDPFEPSMWGPKTRKGTILVFPAAIYDEAAAELEDGTDYQEFADKYEESILIEITQKEESSGIKVLESGWNEKSVREETDEDILSYLKYDLGIEEVYAVDAAAGTFMTLNPSFELFGEDEGEPVGQFFAVTPDGSDIDSEDIGLRIGSIDDDGHYYLEVETTDPFTSPIIIVFIDGTYVNKKALVIYPE